MPELLDLQVFSSNLHHKLKSKSVKNIKLYRTKNTNCSEEDLNIELQNKAILQIIREGKEVYVEFKKGII